MKKKVKKVDRKKKLRILTARLENIRLPEQLSLDIIEEVLQSQAKQPGYDKSLLVREAIAYYLPYRKDKRAKGLII